MMGIRKLGGRRSENEKRPLRQRDENEFNLALKCTKIKKNGGINFVSVSGII
jgi:hypothetical protein